MDNLFLKIVSSLVMACFEWVKILPVLLSSVNVEDCYCVRNKKKRLWIKGELLIINSDRVDVFRADKRLLNLLVDDYFSDGRVRLNEGAKIVELKNINELYSRLDGKVKIYFGAKHSLFTRAIVRGIVGDTCKNGIVRIEDVDTVFAFNGLRIIEMKFLSTK
jgi:hypothetical protein